MRRIPKKLPMRQRLTALSCTFRRMRPNSIPLNTSGASRNTLNERIIRRKRPMCYSGELGNHCSVSPRTKSYYENLSRIPIWSLDCNIVNRTIQAYGPAA